MWHFRSWRRHAALLGACQGPRTVDRVYPGAAHVRFSSVILPKQGEAKREARRVARTYAHIVRHFIARQVPIRNQQCDFESLFGGCWSPLRGRVKIQTAHVTPALSRIARETLENVCCSTVLSHHLGGFAEAPARARAARRRPARPNAPTMTPPAPHRHRQRSRHRRHRRAIARATDGCPC